MKVLIKLQIAFFLDYINVACNDIAYCIMLVPLLHFWSIPSVVFKIKLTGTAWDVQNMNKVLINIVITIK